MPGEAMLERYPYQLPAEVQERLEELRVLSKKAEEGDEDAKRELKRAVRQSAPEVIARASDVGRRAQHLLIETAAGGNMLTEYALSGRLDVMRSEIAGENPTPLEVLLTERVVACWMLVQLFDALMAAQLWKGAPKRSAQASGRFATISTGRTSPTGASSLLCRPSLG